MHKKSAIGFSDRALGQFLNRFDFEDRNILDPVRHLNWGFRYL